MNYLTQHDSSAEHRFCRRLDTDRCSHNDYRPPVLRHHGTLGSVIRGASWKGVDSVGELNPNEGSYPG